MCSSLAPGNPKSQGVRTGQSGFLSSVFKAPSIWRAAWSIADLFASPPELFHRITTTIDLVAMLSGIAGSYPENFLYYKSQRLPNPGR